MALTKLNIPPTINVGFQRRNDTYTGRLAYVIYTDQKGKLRKAKSWNNWCNHKQVKPVEFVNEPTEGFVLNKKVGGGNYGWHSRMAKVRIYDPRDFEFEITVENLLFILEECSAIKGKGIEGEFVYAWEKDKLVLLPVSSLEYKTSKVHTANQSKKVTKDDIVEGCVYQTKKGFQVMYLGRHAWQYETKGQKKFPRGPEKLKKEQDKRDKVVAACKKKHGDTMYRWHLPYEHRYEIPKTEYRDVHTTHSSKKHIFVSLDGKTKTQKPDYRDGWGQIPYLLDTGYTKLALKLSDEPDPRFPEEYEKLMKLKYITGKLSKPKKPKKAVTKKKVSKKKAVFKKAKKKAARKSAE